MAQVLSLFADSTSSKLLKIPFSKLSKLYPIIDAFSQQVNASRAIRYANEANLKFKENVSNQNNNLFDYNFNSQFLPVTNTCNAICADMSDSGDNWCWILSSNSMSIIDHYSSTYISPCFLHTGYFKDVRWKRKLKMMQLETYNSDYFSMQHAFSKIYESTVWGSMDNEGGYGSGPGSSMEGSKTFRNYLLSVIRSYNIDSMLDAACGSMNWMPYVLNEIEATKSQFYYIGVDIVPSVIISAREKYADKKRWKFYINDICSIKFNYSESSNLNSTISIAKDTITEQSLDLIIVRDTFFHLSYDKIKCALNSLSAIGGKYLLATTDPYSWGPEPIIAGKLNSGGFRRVNLLGPPFYLSKPIECSPLLNNHFFKIPVFKLLLIISIRYSSILGLGREKDPTPRYLLMEASFSFIPQ
jgi:hypothetical protein